MLTRTYTFSGSSYSESVLAFRLQDETNLLLKWVGGQMVSDVSWAQASFGFTKLLDLKINLKFQGKLLQGSLCYFM